MRKKRGRPLTRPASVRSGLRGDEPRFSQRPTWGDAGPMTKPKPGRRADRLRNFAISPQNADHIIPATRELSILRWFSHAHHWFGVLYLGMSCRFAIPTSAAYCIMPPRF